MRALALALALIAWVSPAFAARTGARTHWPMLVHAPTLAALDSLTAINGRAAGARLDSLLAAAIARRDSTTQLALDLKRATWRMFAFAALDEADATAARWEPSVRALGDTLAWCWVLRIHGYADLQRERYRESDRSYTRMLFLSRRARLRPMEGYALLGTSWIAMQDGHHRIAERGYRRALVLLAPEPDQHGVRTARAGLANALLREGRTDEARLEYERVLAEARAARDRFNEAAALNDLGALDSEYGDPSIAEPYYRAAATLHQQMRLVSLELNCRRNVAFCMMRDGRAAMAVGLLDSLVRASVAAGARDMELRALSDLGLALSGQGRVAEAESVLTRAVGLKDSSSYSAWVDALSGLAGLELETGRGPSALRRLQEAREAVVRRTGPAYTSGFLLLLGRAQRETGTPRTAIATLREGLLGLRGRGGTVGAGLVRGESEIAACFRALGLRDSALSHLQLAAEGWESHRADPSDLEWRRAFDREAPRLYGSYVAAVLDPARGGSEASRAAEAFDVMQRFRSRTLEDQLRGTQARNQLPRVSLARLQRTVLRPGEVLLDIFCAPDTSIVFAVTRNSCRAAWLPGAWAARQRLARLRGLLASPDATREALKAGETALGRDLFSPVAGELRGARAVLVSGGWLDEYPLGMLIVPGEREPLATSRTFSFVPSATLLAASRASPLPRAKGARFEGLCRTTDAAGRRLPGIDDEVRWLRRRFPDAHVRSNDGRLSLEQMLGRRVDAEVIHLASHTRISAGSPWRSGFLLGRGDGEAAYLTADRIARLHAPARVCVLAGCNSAGSVGVVEGMPNLAAAWLTAGAGCVVATLWPVEDRATSRLVEQFYETLTRGATVGEALTAAQRAVRAEQPDPRYWAGFVLLGDPSTKVPSLGRLNETSASAR